jgi:hypothetical protein
MAASPMETVNQRWGGKLPEFDSVAAVNELLNTLVAPRWNRLTTHQNSRNPFRLLRFDVAQMREGLKHFALLRRQELDVFVEGLFGLEEHIDLSSAQDYPTRLRRTARVEAHVRATDLRLDTRETPFGVTPESRALR